MKETQVCTRRRPPFILLPPSRPCRCPKY